MSDEPDATTFDAAVNQVRTLADGGIRVVLDLPETALDAAMWLMTKKRDETPLKVACVAVPPKPALCKLNKTKRDKGNDASAEGNDEQPARPPEDGPGLDGDS